MVVDDQANSIDDQLLHTERQTVCDIKPMTQEMIWKLDQFQELFKHAKEVGLDDTLFAVLGGVPSRYELMQASIKTQLQTGQDPHHVVGDYLCDQIFNAIQLILRSRRTSLMTW